MSIVPYEPADNGTRAWIELLPAAAELAKAIANTEFVPKSLRGNPASIAAAVLYGDEVGLGPMQSLSRIAVIDGKPTLASETQRALILQAGHEMWVEEATQTKVTVAGKRRNSDQTSRITWTLDDARRANLAGRPAWKLYPRQMLLARASAELARAMFADAIGGLAATEEIEEEGTVPAAADVPEPKKTRSRKRKVTNLSATVSGGGDPPPPDPPGAAGPPLPGEEGMSAVDVELEMEQAKEAQAIEEDPPAQISEAQMKKLQALFREKQVTTREGRISYCVHVIGHDIDTSSELTMEEASQIIDALEQWDPSDPKSKPFPNMNW